ncbi:MAG: tetratricopeptide repeat protein [Akkermansiaceae bacterium]
MKNEVPNSNILADLHQQLHFYSNSGQSERVIETAQSLLQQDPESAWLHETLGKAFLDEGRTDEAQKHIVKAIALDPNNASSFGQLSRLELIRGRMGTAEDNIQKAIQLDPESSWNWYIAGLLAIHFDDYQRSMLCVAKIRELDPESLWADEIEASAKRNIDGIQKAPKEQQLADQFKILEKNPESDQPLHTIAVIYANEYNDLENAEAYSRKAIAKDPTDKANQKLLFSILRKRDPVLKFLWLPFQPVKLGLQLIAWSWEKKWPLIFMFFITKYIVILGAASFCFFGIFFWPLTKAYEYLTLADIHKKMGKLSLYSGPMAKLHKQPFLIRFILFLTLISIFWGGIIAAFSDESMQRNGKAFFIGGVVTLAIVFVAGSWILHFYQKFKASRRNKKLN